MDSSNICITNYLDMLTKIKPFVQFFFSYLHNAIYIFSHFSHCCTFSEILWCIRCDSMQSHCAFWQKHRITLIYASNTPQAKIRCLFFVRIAFLFNRKLSSHPPGCQGQRDVNLFWHANQVGIGPQKFILDSGFILSATQRIFNIRMGS